MSTIMQVKMYDGKQNTVQWYQVPERDSDVPYSVYPFLTPGDRSVRSGKGEREEGGKKNKTTTTHH